MGASISGERVLQTLSEANEMALIGGWKLDDSLRRTWSDHFERLEGDKTPKTYLAVLAVTLCARSMYEQEELDVFAIKAGSGPRGYSAPSIGSKLASFVKEQGIDLRATSSQPMNNQPFTFEDRIVFNMGVQKNSQGHWEGFFAAVSDVQSLQSEVALQVLAMLFERRRLQEKPKVVVHSANVDKASLGQLISVVCEFVSANSESGKVGQAFSSALYSLIYGATNVLQGNSQDPDAGMVGDVHVAYEEVPWLWVEVKQKVVSTGDLKGFLDKVSGQNGARASYFALNNAKYSSNIQDQAVFKHAESLGMEIEIYKDCREAADALLPFAAGSFQQVAESLCLALYHRLIEASTSASAIADFKMKVAPYATFVD
jgi:hypothetical protein